MPEARAGGCLCGGVRFEVRGPMRAVVFCHCGLCRRTTGHYMASTNVATADLVLKRDDTLRWFHSSDAARRGFCGTCGASLFWQADGGDRTAIAAGALDMPTGLGGERHIFVADQGDWYAIADGLPQE